MSNWLSFNDSFNNIKGQLTNFATSVLADDTDNLPGPENYGQLKDICLQQDAKIKELEAILGQKQSQTGNDAEGSAWNWTHDQPLETGMDSQKDQGKLDKRVQELENEKQELVNQLEQLDLDNQQNMVEIMSIKDKLQEENSDLKDKLDKTNQLNRKLRKTIEDKQQQAQNESSTDLVKDLEQKNQDLEQNNQDLETKIGKLHQDNDSMCQELQKCKQLLTDYEKKSLEDSENCAKLAIILDTYEKQVGALKEELNSTKTSAEVPENDTIHLKYVSILTKYVKRYIDGESNLDIGSENDPQAAEFSKQVENIMKVLSDLQLKCETLDREVCELSQDKTKLLTEKNFEIEKLMQNQELLSQDLIGKGQAVKEYELECAELEKNNDLLIKELEELKHQSGLQTISESNEDNLLLMETQLENANKRIEDLERIIDDLEKQQTNQDNTIDKAQLETTTEQVKELEEIIFKLEQDNASLKQTISENTKLKTSLEKMRTELDNSEYQITEVNINIESLKEEVEAFRQKVDSLLEENRSISVMYQESEAENKVLTNEVQNLREKLQIAEDRHKQLDQEIKNLTEKVQNSKVSETSLKLQCDTLNKELKTALESKTSLEQSIEQNKHETLEDVDLDKSKIEEMSTEIEQLRLKLSGTETTHNGEVQEKQQQVLQLQDKLSNLESELETVNNARLELINLIQTKDLESVTYYNEIQRLSQILQQESEKSHLLENQLKQHKEADRSEAMKEDNEKLTDQNNFLRQKCEVLAENLLKEQARYHALMSEKPAATEREQSLVKELERLKTHLIEVEETLTQELVEAEHKNADLIGKMKDIEEREKNSSTMYTSISIRANQQVEVLQKQVQSLTGQREDLRRKVSENEDLNTKQAAALANLQFVLEQFQKDKDKVVHEETERIRRRIQDEKRIQTALQKDIGELQQQLEESRQGLQAASRLSEQLEHSKKLQTSLKDEVSQLKTKLEASEAKLNQLSNQTDGKIEKSLIKNLIIGYVFTNPSTMSKDQNQILKIIATVLDFNQQDHDKVNSNKNQGSWLGSLLIPQTGQNMSDESLSKAFVKFLENESKPRVVPSLLAPEEKNSSAGSSRKVSQTGQSPIVLSEIVLPTFADFGQSRNSSSILKDVLKDNSHA